MRTSQQHTSELAEPTTLRLKLQNANPEAQIAGIDEQAGKSHYLIGNDPSHWRKNVPNYAKVAYDEVYPGIDLIYYGNQRQLEYDFIVAPNANPKTIKMAIEGAEKVSIDPDGNLILTTPNGEIRQHKPIVYQETNGQRRPIEGRYVLLANGDSNNVPEGVNNVPDGVFTPSATFAVSGNGSTQETKGTGYISRPAQEQGFTVRPEPVEGRAVKPIMVRQAHHERPNLELSRVKLKAAETQIASIGFEVAEYDHSQPLVIDPVLVYSTYLGGSAGDYGLAIDVDHEGKAYIAGNAASVNFPITNGAYATTKPGGTTGPDSYDAFITKLSADGSTLLYSTYLGGTNQNDQSSGIAVNDQGNAYVVGSTWSSNFPVTPGAYFSPLGGQAYVAKLSPDGSSLVYAAIVGGYQGLAIAVDADGNAYVTGDTFAATIATTSGSPQPNYGGGRDGYVVKLNASGTALSYASYLGRGGTEQGLGIDIDSSGKAFVVGVTTSSDYPTVNPVQAQFGGGSVHGDGFVTVLNPEGTQFVFSSFLGGASDDAARDIAIDHEGHVYVTGNTESSNFPLHDAFQPNFGGVSYQGGLSGDAFLTKLDIAQPRLIFSTYLGGSGDDGAFEVEVDGLGNSYIAGTTRSSNFPLKNPIQANFAGGSRDNGAYGDIFLAKINPSGSELTFSTYLGGSDIDYAYAASVDRCGDAYLTGGTYSADFPTHSPLQASFGGGFDAFVSKVLFDDTTDLSLTKTATPDPILTGNQLTYHLTVNNLCAKDATGVKVSDLLPAQFAFTAATATQGSCNAQNGQLNCELGNIGPKGSAEITVTGTVNAPTSLSLTNQASVSADQDDPDPRNNTASATALLRTSQGVLGNDSDPDGDALNAKLLTNAAHGTLNLNPDGTFTYAPQSGFSGVDTFTYQANDGKLDSNIATVTITVNKVNHPPQITSTAVTTATATQAYGYQVTATDPDADDTLTFALGDHPAGMTIDNATGLIQWTPTAEQTGVHSVAVSVADSGGLSQLQTFTVTVTLVTPPNRAPVAQDGTFSAAGIVLQQPAPGVLANDSDPDGDMIIALLVSGPANGTLNLSPDGSFTYTPNAGFIGADTFTYKASDGKLDSNLATVTITVTEANQPPVITSKPNTAQWIQLNPLGQKPTARYIASQRTYDEVNDRLIVFGGLDKNAARLNDVWVLSHASGTTGTPEWSKLAPTGTGPSNRSAFVSAYDSTANRLIIYGGCTGFCGSVGDAWVLTHANGLGGDPEWLPLPTGATLGFGTGDYDPVTNWLIVFGGLPGGSGSDWSKVQILEDANGIGDPHWKELSVAGTAPSPRGHDQPGIYDPLSNTLIVFGGITSSPSVGFNDVWVLSHANGIGGAPAWTELQPVGTAPPPGIHTVTYDPNSARLIVHGGQIFANGNTDQKLTDSWVLTHANGQGGVPEWVSVEPSTLSNVYEGASIGYARTSNRLIETMGLTTEAGATNDTWVLTNASGNCTANQPCDYDVEASDADAGDVLSYALLQGPTGMTIEAGTGQLHWTPGAAQTGTHDVTVKVTDAGGLSATQNFQLTVSPVAVPNVQGLAPEWADAMLQAAGLNTGAKSSLGGAITLNFDTLPSEQGWNYFAYNNSVPENQVFQLDEGMLKQDSIGAGFQGQGSNRYNFWDIVDYRLPSEITIRARVLQEEGDASNPCGFGFGSFTGREASGICLGTAQLQDQRGKTGPTIPFDNTFYHDYRLKSSPGGEFNFFADNSQVHSGPIVPTVFQNHLNFGDGTGGTNAKAEIAAYSFSQPQIATQTPSPGTLVNPASAVDLGIQEGPATQTVPAVSGQAQTDAQTDIIAAGLLVGNVTTEASTTVPGGSVIRQKPVAGTHIMKNFKVDLVISSAPGNRPPTITSTPVTTANTGELYSYDVDATDPDAGDVLTYSLTTAPAGMSIDTATGLIQWTPVPTHVGNQSVIVKVQDQGGLSVTQGFTIAVSQTNHAPVISSTPPAGVKAEKLYSYAVAATDPDAGDALTYTFASGVPSGMSLDAASGLLQWTPTAAQVGTHSGIIVKVSDQKGLFATQSIDITVKPANRAPSIGSSAPSVATENEPYIYAVQAGDPDAGDTLGYSLPTAPAGMTINQNTGLISWTPASTQIGEHPVIVQVQDQDGLSTTQGYTVTVAVASVIVPNVEGISLAAARAALTAAQLVPGNELYLYDEIVPAGLVLSQQPPAGASVAKKTAVDLIVSQGPAPVSVPSVVGFTQAAAESALLAAKLVVGTMTPVESDTIPDGIVISQAPSANTPVPKNTPVDLVVSSGPALISTPNVVGLDETAAEAALLAANLVVGAKSAVNSDTVPTGLIISQNPAAGVKLAKGSAVDLLVSRGPAAPELAAIQVLPESPLLLTGETLTFSALAILDDGTSQSLSGATWTSATPSVATVNASGVVTALAEGQTLISTKKGGVTGSVTLTVKATAPGDVTPPDAAITAPVGDATITSPTDITGTASDANFLKYELALSPVGQNQFTVFKTGDTAVSNGVLGTLDPTLLLNDQYTLRLTVWDRRNNRAQSELRVQVAREQKVGNFTLAFQDVSVPMACMPLTVTRVYDSRDKRKGDFGIGWRLDVKTMQLRESREMGSGWHVDLVNRKIGFVTIQVYVLSADDVHKVSLTLPDGQVEEFDLTVSPTENRVFPISTVNLAYSPRPGTLGSLAPVGPTEWGLSGEQGTVEFIDSDTNVFDPQQYRYTAPDGSVYIIDKNAGVQSVQCINGQKLNFDANGISHSDGAGVAFTRDGQNRITAITDSMGNSHQYSYDSNGDLVQHSDPANQKTGFKYDYRHGLIEIDDPRGIKAVRNEYDANGRLIGNTDAAGKKITYNHDLAARTETVTDRLGNSTAYEYNNKGNVLKQTDALGNVTTYTYDAVGNQLTKTDALGRTTTQDYDSRRNVLRETDSLGHVTRYTYHALNGVKTIQDPLGHVTTNDYDGNGNLLSTADPLGNVTTYGYDKGGIIYPGSGLMTARTDALGNKTRYNYDTQGRITTETDPQGNVTSYDYDANGNRTKETRTRTLPGGGTETLVTTFEYDSLNRLVKTIQADGSTSRTVYNAIGKQAQTVDALGHSTRYEYDALGHLIKTIYPDGAFETSGYDAEGRRIESTDRAGRKTAYTYDALGRLTLTTYADGTSSSTIYDQAGQVTASVDALGHVTSYTYDDAGRRTQVTDALGHVTRFVYDAAGNQSQVTDANGHVTTFVYDNGNRRTAVLYPDGTQDQTGYDALGRNISKTDQAGKLTQFAYDALGRLITVTDALGQITTYGYDERGNQVSQRDANGHTTTFAYDSMGRRISRTLPEGQTEHMAYNAAGNLTAKTDFNGKTTTYAYDELNRLITKTPDASLGEPAVTYDYTVSGQRTAMQDASGLSTYSYDVRDRLIEKATPQGTLTYTYNGAGQLDSIQSNHADGVDLSYSYDALNRLAKVTDQGLGNADTTYSYDNAGSLAGYVYPNGVETAYTYNALNRLTDMHVAKAGTDVARYQYTLGATGNRISVAELNGRTVNYLYDNLYRLTRETISGVATPTQNGEIAYTYDPVGNRLTRTSTVGGIANQSFTYNANDQLNTDAYDANGNTIGTDGKTYAYDGDNRLISQNGVEVQIVYDGDGNRVAKTVGGVTTQYLVDTLNPTGYAQVLEEIENGSVVRRYSYGSDLISQSLKLGSGWQTYFYGYDGHGSVRFLTDASGNVTDRYDYEGFGNLVNQEGTTANSYLYSGEQRDKSLGLDYLRARWMAQIQGRFISRDMYEGRNITPLSLHSYSYVEGNPVNRIDPEGTVALYLDLLISTTMRPILTQPYAQQTALYARACRNVLGTYCPLNDPDRTTRFTIEMPWDSTVTGGPLTVDPALEISFATITAGTESRRLLFIGLGASLSIPGSKFTSTVSSSSLAGTRSTSFQTTVPMTARDFQGFGAIVALSGAYGVGGSGSCAAFWASSYPFVGICGWSSTIGYTPPSLTVVLGLWQYIGI